MENDVVKRTVLFVDDEPNILSSLKRGLHKEDYNKIFVGSGKEAIETIKRNKIEVLVTDMRMPEMTGLELMKIVEESNPDIVKIVLSGYTQLPQILATVNQVNIYKFITKPWDLEADFKRIIREAIEFYNMKSDNERLKVSLEKKNALYQKLLKINDEKLTSTKNDSEVMKSCLNTVISYSKSQIFSLEDLKKKKEALINFDYIDIIMDEVLKIFPSEYKYFNFEYMKTDLDAALRRDNDVLNKYGEKEFPDSKVFFIPYSDQDIASYEFYHTYKSLFISMKLAVTKLFTSRFDDEFYITVKESGRTETDLDMTLIINSKRNKILEDKNKVDYIKEIMNNILIYFGGKAHVAMNASKHIVVLELRINIEKS